MLFWDRYKQHVNEINMESEKWIQNSQYLLIVLKTIKTRSGDCLQPSLRRSDQDQQDPAMERSSYFN